MFFKIPMILQRNKKIICNFLQFYAHHVAVLSSSNESWCHKLNQPASFTHSHVLGSMFSARDSEVKGIDFAFKALTNKTIK